MSAPIPDAEQHRREAPEGAPMMFEWRRCPRHPWLGVSILQVGDSTAVCYTETGHAHPVDPSELERAA